jgi:GPI mannosyltransferase 3
MLLNLHQLFIFFRMIRFLQQQLPGIPVRFCLIVSLMLHISAAWFCDGFFHPDEHFQILEFAQFKLGLSPASDLAWEYSAKIRPALQPCMVMGIYKIASTLHVTDPFIIAFILRLLTSIAAWFLAMALCIIVLRWLKRDLSKKVLFLLSCFFWCLPFFHCRFSSENASGIAFFAACAIIFSTSYSTSAAAVSRKYALWKYFCAGLLLGFAFYLRFPMGVAVVGIGAWMLFIRRISPLEFMSCSFAFCVACCINIGIDRWFYGTWELTPVSYYVENIVKGAGNGWGVYPWWYYIVQLLVNLVPPYSIVMLAAFFLTWYKCWRSPLVWAVGPFFLAHCAIGHKEFRFMLPLLYALPALMVMGLDSVQLPTASRLKRFIASRSMKIFFNSFIVVNCLLLVVFSFKPGKEIISVYKWLYRASAHKSLSLATFGDTPYKSCGLAVNFYRAPHVNLKRFCCADSLKAVIKQTDAPMIACLDDFSLADSLKDPAINWSVQCRSIPSWLASFNINDWLSRVHVWTVYSAQRNKKDRI